MQSIVKMIFQSLKNIINSDSSRNIMSELTQEQINQRRREKILARSRKLELSESSPTLVQTATNQLTQQQKAPLLQNAQTTTPQLPRTPKSQPSENNQASEQQVDAFTRFREIQAKAKRQKYLLIFSKILGVIVAVIQVYLLSVIKKYENKFNSNEIPAEVFQRVQQKFIDQLDLIYWACFGTITFAWVWIKFVRSTRQNCHEKFQIIPGTTIFSLLEQLNKVMEYKVLIKALLGYTFSCIVVHLVLNQAILLLGAQGHFYKPNLANILTQITDSTQNQQIL